LNKENNIMALLDTTILTPKQDRIARAAKTYFGRKTVVSREELVAFMNKTFNLKYDPNFITKNLAFKHKDPKTGEIVRGMFVLPKVTGKAPKVEVKSAKTAKAPKTAAVAKTPKTLSNSKSAIAKRAKRAEAKKLKDLVPETVEAPATEQVMTASETE
jgi:hypothetical protein